MSDELIRSLKRVIDVFLWLFLLPLGIITLGVQISPENFYAKMPPNTHEFIANAHQFGIWFLGGIGAAIRNLF